MASFQVRVTTCCRLAPPAWCQKRHRHHESHDHLDHLGSGVSAPRHRDYIDGHRQRGVSSSRALAKAIDSIDSTSHLAS